jgi:hypothetical protein
MNNKRRVAGLIHRSGSQCGFGCGCRATRVLCLVTVVLLAVGLRSANGTTVYSGYLPFTDEGPEDRFVTGPSTPEDEIGYTVGNFFGENTVRLIQKVEGDWNIRILTYSEVNNVTLTGGNLQEVTGSVSISTMGQMSGPGPFPSSLTLTGEFGGTVTVGTNSFHDGSLTFGNYHINSLEDFFLTDSGVYEFPHATISSTVPVNASGAFQLNISLHSESWSRLDVTSGDFANTMTLTSILMPNGSTPESAGFSLSFDDGRSSPNAEPGDYNGDGNVDAADYVVWRKNDGMQPGYNTWRANFGASGSGNSLGRTSNVPEPATSTLLVIVLITATCRCRRHSGYLASRAYAV